MKASRSNVRCGVVARYCSQTCCAIAAAEALVFKVEGPEERVAGVTGAGAEVVEAACRLAGMVAGTGGCWVLVEDRKGSSGIVRRMLKECRTVGSNSRLLNNSMAWGKEDQLMPAGSFVIGEGHVVDMPPLVGGEVHQLHSHFHLLIRNRIANNRWISSEQSSLYLTMKTIAFEVLGLGDPLLVGGAEAPSPRSHHANLMQQSQPLGPQPGSLLLG